MAAQEHSFNRFLEKSKNLLLLKDDVGKPKTCLRKLPSPDHIYGVKGKNHSSEGVGSLISTWQYHTPSKAAKPLKNYMIGKRSPKRSLERPAQVFTKKQRPADPIKSIINFEYGNQANQQLDVTYKRMLANKKRRQPRPNNSII